MMPPELADNLRAQMLLRLMLQGHGKHQDMFGIIAVYSN